MFSPRLLLIAALLGITACGGSTVQETLGLETSAPDEFRVVSRPPLSVPPQFYLRPPSIGDDINDPYATDRKAKELITGGTADATNDNGQTFVLGPAASDISAQAIEVIPGDTGNINAESQFLKNIGASRADPSVRKALVEERYIKQEKREEEEWWEIWGSSEDKKESTINATKEKERIQKNQDEGKPINDGETPVIKPKDRGILGRILGD